METTEKVTYTNHFGTVTDKRLILNYKSGTEDIPIGQISSISFQHRRNYFFAIGSFVATVVLLIFMFSNLDNIRGAETLIILLLVLFFILSGIANWIGHHNIVVSAVGQNRKPLKVEMAKTKDGRQFVDAVKKSIFK
jgi:heme A synthase